MIVYHTGNEPERAHPDDAGYDLVASESETISSSSVKLIGTGIAIDIPHPMCGMIVSRSGMALNGLIVMNSPGIIDPGYRGEIKVMLYNSTDKDYTVRAGDRVAQIVFVNTVAVLMRQVERLENTDRNTSGFGSTGR
jgi:dUTP pyrophosphatase